MTFSIKLAEVFFTIKTLYTDTELWCKDYLTDQSGYEIMITRNDIEKEKVYHVKEAMLEGYLPMSCTEGILETTAVYRKIADYFSCHNGAVAHGALIAYRGVGYLFMAPSGTGKTTHIRNWLACFPETSVINGDKPVLRLIDDKLIGYGTPWCGKEGMNINASVPVKAIIFLHRAEENSITKIPLKTAFSKIMAAVYHSEDAEGMKRMMYFIAQMQGKVSFYELSCNMNIDSAQVAYEGISVKC